MSSMVLPERLGRYDVVRRLASGALTESLLGRLGEGGGGRDVVLKRLLGGTGEAVDEALREDGRRATRLNHPSLARVLEVCEDADGPFLVLEHVDGPSLASLLEAVKSPRDRLSVAEVVHVALDVARALEHAHGLTDESGRPAGLVHGDVTPSNIYVTRQGDAKLTDFGLARARARLAATQGVGVLARRLEYMAPEAVLSGATDARADLFSLGAVVWQALTGRSAFAADTEAHTIMRLTSETPHVPSSFHKFVPDALDALVMRLLHRVPGRRFARASEVIAALERLAPHDADAVSGEAQLARRVAKLLGEHAPESIQRRHATTRPSTKTRVLVAHRSRAVREHATASLGDRFSVADASTAAGARALMSVDGPSIVVCDAALRGTPGLELCRWMRAAPKLASIPFVLLADEVTTELCSEALKAGAQAVLPEGFDGDHLVATVDRLVDEAKR